jgi:hypothetical protein
MADTERSYQILLDCLRRLRRRVVAVELAATLILALAAALLGLLLWVTVEALFYLAPAARTVGGLATVLGAALVGAIYLRRHLPALLSLHRFGLRVEERCPALKERLTSALQLWRAERARRLYSNDLLSATVERAATLLGAVENSQILDWRPLKTHVRYLGLTTLLTLGTYALFSAELVAALYRCAHPLTAFVRQPRTHIDIAPGDLEIVKGEDAVVVAKFRGDAPRSAAVLQRAAATAPWQREVLVVDQVDSLVYTFKQVMRPFTYQIVAGDGRSQIHRVQVIDPPAVQRLRLEYRYPAYSGLPVRRDEEGGDIACLVGTQVSGEINATKALRAAALVLDDTLRLEARVEDRKAYFEFDIAHSGRYHIELLDRKEVPNHDPIRYTIQALADEAPRVALTEPGRDLDLPETMEVLLAAEANDDFGVDRLALVYRVNDGSERQIPLAINPNRQIQLTHIWELDDSDLLPEDRVFYHLVAWDNDTVTGPKQSASRQYVLRYPSLYELFEEIGADEQVSELEELVEEGEKTAEYLEQVRREVLKHEELSWEQKKELEATLGRETERARAVEELAQQLQEDIDQLAENELASEELLEKLEEIRALMAAVTSPELQEAIQAMKQAMEELNPDQLASAIEEFQQDQAAFQERLDRTLALLKQVQAEQRLEAAVEQARDLERRQAQINEELDRGDANERLQEQEQSLGRDTERLQEELHDLSQTMEQFNRSTAQDLENQAQAMQNQALAPRMQEMMQHMQGEQKKQAQREGAALEEDLGSLTAGLEHMQQKYSAEEKEKLGREMRQTMYDLLHLSQRQEHLQQRTQEEGRSKLQDLAQEQFALRQGIGHTAERIAAISRQTMSLSRGLGVTLGYVLHYMEQAAQNLGQQEAAAAVAPQGQSMGYLNEAVLLLRESLDNLAQSRMPSGFAETMQKMMGLSEQQADLNQATQQTMQQGRQQGLPDIRATMRRLAAEQQRIHQALQQLKQGMRGHRGSEKRISAIEEEMESLLRDMQHQRPDARVTAAQQRILQRMLDASRSIHTRGFKQQRQSQSGEDTAYRGRGRLPDDLGQHQDVLRAAMQNALQGPYPDEYRPPLRQYYEGVYQDLVEREEKTP